MTKFKNIYFPLLFTISLIPFTWLFGQETGDYLITNGTVLTITDGIKENTDILIKDGIVDKIGTDLSVGSDIPTYDAEGQFVIPGIIDAHSHIALQTVNESSKPVTAEVKVGDAVDPYDVDIYRALAGGVTTSHLMHGSANAVGGQCETIKHRYGSKNPEELKMEGAPRTIKFALGENPMRVHGEGKKVKPRTRMGVEQVFRNAFSEALEYKNKWENYTNDKTRVPPKYDIQKEALLDILEGDLIIHCHSYRADEILMLLQVCEDFGIEKICFQHVNEGFKVAPELAEYGAYASVFSDWWAYKFEVYYSTAYNAAILTKNGVITSINSDSRDINRHLYHEAAKSQKYGNLSDNEALKLITLNPAIQLGIEDRVGSIEVGKEADIAVFSHHPLSIYTICQMTLVDGIKKFDIKTDEDDMRIHIDPDEETPTSYEYSEEVESCMEDVYNVK